ncbi:MAG: hypothetical protein JWP15_2769 [Alphaproteobacteria bacterium]|nr:hypothetical protein [Alphaproteobacteria bacterium]
MTGFVICARPGGLLNGLEDKRERGQIMRRLRTVTIPLFALGLPLLMAGQAAAQNDETPCTTKSECDFRAEQRDMRIRQADWDANVRRERDFDAQRQQIRAQVRAENENGKLTRIQEIMRRRRAAAAAAGN